MGVLRGYLYWKVVLGFWFGHPKCHFWYPQNDQNDPFWSFWGYQKWHFGCPNQNSETTFIDQNHPQNPQKDTLGTQIDPRKVIFGHFAFFWYFYLIFPLARALFFKSISTHQKLTPDKKENFSQLLKHINQRKNTSPLTNFHFCYFQPYLVYSVLRVNGIGLYESLVYSVLYTRLSTL